MGARCADAAVRTVVRRRAGRAEVACNTVNGRWALDGDAIAIAALAQTRRLCVPDSVMTQETALVTVLSAARRVVILKQLTLLHPAGVAEVGNRRCSTA